MNILGKMDGKNSRMRFTRRYSFTPAKVEVEEHHVKVYAGKKTDEIIKAPHPETLLRGSWCPRLWRRP